MPIRDYKLGLNAITGQTMVDGNYSTDESYFGYADPNVGRGGKFGLHIVVITTYETLTSGGEIWVVHSTGGTSTERHMGRWFAVASLTAGKHYFLPCGHSLKAYARAKFVKTTEDASAGALTLWFGPDEDGAE